MPISHNGKTASVDVKVIKEETFYVSSKCSFKTHPSRIMCVDLKMNVVVAAHTL